MWYWSSIPMFNLYILEIMLLASKLILEAEKMGVDLLEVDRFFHEGFFDDGASLDQNLDTLKLFINKN